MRPSRLGPGFVAVFSLILVVLACGPVFGQAGSATTSLSGIVHDPSGGVIPGADITVKNNATGTTFTGVTGANGTFTIPAINPGTYTVTVALMGFKTWVANDVQLSPAIPATVRVALQVGDLAETVVVEGGTEIVQTTSTAIATTVNVKQIANLPLGSRSALDVVSLMPGVDAATTLRAGNVMGLPAAAVNITLDGVNIQDNYNKSNEIFARVTPRLDAVEEMTFTSAAQGAESAGQGAVQMRFTTRSGTNQLRGSAYYYFQTDKLNGNTWFNERDGLDKPAITLHQPGVRLGGPIVIPGLYDGHNRAFFFFNYEQLRQPTTIKDDRYLLTTSAQSGVFSYNTAAGVVTRNLLQLAAANGQTAQVDPIVARLLGNIRSSTATTGVLNDYSNPNVQRYTWTQPGKSQNTYPTVRLDYNLTDAHRLSFSANYQHIWSSPDTTNSRQLRFPGFPGYGIQNSPRYTWQSTLRSTLGRNLVNEFRVGGTGGTTEFNPNYDTSMWSTGAGDTAGYQLNIANAQVSGTTNLLSNVMSSTTPSSREPYTRVVEDTVNWQKGSHSLSLGASWTRAGMWVKNQTMVPTVNFGIVSGDPAQSMFVAANFPGASGADLTNAQNLYAVLTGRISSIAREARVDEASGDYVVLGQSIARGFIEDWGFHVQDQWRIRTDLTVNAGVRYEIQTPFEAQNASYSNATIADVWGTTGVAPDFIPGSLVNNIGYLYQPNVQKGQAPLFREMTKGTKAYQTDYNNIAPNVGASWTPHAESGWLRRFLGAEGDTVIRGGFSTAFQRNGMSDFQGVLGNNAGISIDATRSQGNNNLGTVPLMFRDQGNLGAPPVPGTRVYPMSPVNQTGSINMFDPNLQVPFARTWTIGYQRALSKTLAAEIRYVGTHNYAGWTTYNYNEYNILENGFLNEFNLAAANLRANVAAGRGSNFKYFGPGTGTSPLPIFLAYFNGVPSTQAGDASRYTSSDFSSNTFLNTMALFNPNPFSAADNLDSSAARRTNATKAGLSPSFLIPNTDMIGGANILGNGGYTTYNGLQLDLRKRMAKGLQFQVNYAYAISNSSTRYSFRVERLPTRQTGNSGGVTHALKFNWVYDLPFGQGKKFASDAGGVMNRIIGNWSFFGTGRVQSGRLLDFGNVRMVGFDEKELLKMFALRIDAASGDKVWMLPADVIDNTVKAYNTSATSPTGYGPLGAPSGKYFAPANSNPSCMETIDNGYGDCGTRTLVVTGPLVWMADMSFAKQVPIKGRVNFEFRWEFYNIFNHVNFTPVTGIGGTAVSSYEVLGALNQQRTSQLIFRLNW
jgi:hypothetical protein